MGRSLRGARGLRAAPRFDRCRRRAEQLVSRGRVAALAEPGEEAHDLQVRRELSAHEEAVDRGHDRQRDRDQPLVGRDDPAVDLECLVEGELLGAVDVEVAVGGRRASQRRGRPGREVLGAHRVQRSALAAERDDHRSLDVAGQRIGEVGGAKERVGDARSLDRLLGGELGAMLGDLGPVLLSDEASGEVADPLQPVAGGRRRNGRGPAVLDRVEMGRVFDPEADVDAR